MASAPKFSSSPCKMNPNLKKAETHDPMRRSFSGNPFTKPSVITNRKAFNPKTPANSPSGFPRRHSTGRESVASLRDPDKENSRDQNLKPTRVKSPALSKGAKNFMSPTISAASKINASPRKQILVERNEPARSSVSFSDVKSLIMGDNGATTPEVALKQKKVSFSDVRSVITEDIESTQEIGSNQKKVSFSDKSIIIEDTESTPEISLNQKVPFADTESTPWGLTHEHEEPLKSKAEFDHKESENDSDSVPKTVAEEKDSVNVDPSFKISPRASISPSCPVLAPLDSDPLVLPYDPKTNYLSPRPQFLHYRPNPRIELYRERDSQQLDELFASESHSDTDVTAETPTEGLQRDLEEISSEETVNEGGEEGRNVSEPNQRLKANRTLKSRFSTGSKFITLLLFLCFACFSVLVVKSPAFTNGMEEISLSNFQVPPEVREFAKANLDRITQNLQHWSASFLSYISDIVSSSREVHKLGSFQYANLSHLIEDRMIEGHLKFDPSVMEPVSERDAGTELFDNKHYREIEADDAVDEDDGEQDDQENEAFETTELVSEEPDEVQQGIEVEIELDHLETEESKGVEFAVEMQAELQSNVDTENQQSVISRQASVIQHDGLNNVDTEPQGDGLNNIAETFFHEEEKSENLKTEDLANNFQSSVAVDFTINGQEEDQFLTNNNMMGFSLLVLCLLAASAFIYTKIGKPSTPNASVPMEQPMPCKKSEYSPVSVSSKDTILEKIPSKNWETELDIANELYPSEMSSYERTSSSYSNKGLKESNQYQIQERKTRKTYRRESLASSDYSTGSPSYGSFTTLDKRPSKHGGGVEEEIVTPVRRSSRIRNQVTSP
ncbi:hypothetical protein ERO13_A03G180400v2 [Gossypium hirsutum]|uniref:Uncharacterized protein n=1 Tax=Gossypium hirsutum TaxID=3635 RepID=A0ABM3ASP3_GOSHI|nr:uncharacterized protein LOC107886970 [Gossypium hirsutum]XP_040957885.1 uncharacterized protein LOC107886970 [Gossypium hirsutum]XP_040957888.1 uncharacterized protein LOC107886970 [Gossypium hirsutum]KAG4209191.1 hypothetical protein ERO13_A03G180400v2 [Gossypium hirsutum]